MKNNINIQKQYNNFNNIYSENLSIEDKIGNECFYNQIDFNCKDKNILDIGSGDGSDCNNYQKMGGIVTGVEPSDNFVKYAKEKYPNCNFILSGGENLPFEDSSFDIVLSKYALQTSNDIKKIFSEISRVLKKDGYILILSKHPIRQFIEQDTEQKDYFKNHPTTSNIYQGKITLHEYSHPMTEYINDEFLKNFDLISFEEAQDFPASEQKNGWNYPTFFIIKARKR